MLRFFKISRWTQFWKPEKNFKLYLEEVAKISNKNFNNEYQTSEGKQVSQCITFILCIFCFKLVQFISLLSFQNNTFYRIITYDMLLFFDCPSSLNTFGISFSGELIYFFYRGYYFANNKKQSYPILLIYKLFYQDFDGYFLNNFKTQKNKKTKWNFLLNKYVRIYQWFFQFCVFFFGNFYLI